MELSKNEQIILAAFIDKSKHYTKKFDRDSLYREVKNKMIFDKSEEYFSMLIEKLIEKDLLEEPNQCCVSLTFHGINEYDRYTTKLDKDVMPSVKIAYATAIVSLITTILNYFL